MSSADTEVRYLTASHDLDDYDILAMETLSVAVPYKTTESLRRLIWAAMVTYVFGNSSVDHVIRRYGHLWERRADKSFESDPRLLILRNTQEDVKYIAEALEKTSISQTLGHVCAKSALCRLEATFKAAYGLVRRNYIFETEAVIRMLLEQLAWAHQAHSTDDDGLRVLNPTKCITGFKSVFPAAGKFYGELSEGAHLDPSIVENYLRFHKNGSKVIRRSTPDSQHSGYYMTALSSVYLEVVQKLFTPFGKSEYKKLDQRLRKHHRDYCNLLNDQRTDA
jgi:hypothetical protein